MIKKLLPLILIVLLIAGCARNKDKFAHYRNMNAAQIFNGSEMALAKGRYAAAVNGFQASDAMFPFGPYARQGQLDIIYAYFKNGNKAESIAAADRYIRLYPRGPYVDYAYYMKGIVSFTMGTTILQRAFHANMASQDLAYKKQAFVSFAQVVNFYPNSLYAYDASMRMAYIRNLLAEKSLEIADYYYDRKAYIAAANRAAFVVRHFEGTPAVIPSLALMVKSYRKIGLDNMANKTMAIFAASYPKHAALLNPYPHHAPVHHG